MRFRNAIVSKWAVLTVCAVVGCRTQTSRMPYADNPLLQSREPIVQAAPATRATSTYGIIQTPTNLPNVSSSANKSNQSIAAAPFPNGPTLESFNPKNALAIQQASAIEINGTKTQPLELPVVASSTVKDAPKLAPETTPVAVAPPLESPRPPVQLAKFDHANDYSWLQGEVDCHYRGHKELRFCPPSDEDAIGGKVRLADDPRLAELQPGDVVRVEGIVVRDADGQGTYPQYKIRSVKMIQRRGGAR